MKYFILLLNSKGIIRKRRISSWGGS